MSTENSRVAIGLGSNLGDRETQLVRAVRGLAAVIAGIKVGGLYESAALDSANEPRYLNSALVGLTHLSPEPLLAVLKFLEQQAGRRRGRRWGSRPLDLDLLLFGDEVSTAPQLTLPHSQLARRCFVLAPLADVAPQLRVPPDGHSVAALLARLDQSSLERIDWTEQPAGAAGSNLAACYPPPRPRGRPR